MSYCHDLAKYTDDLSIFLMVLMLFFTSLAILKGGCVAMATGHATGLWEVKECSSAHSKYICRQDKDSSFSPNLPKPQPTPPVTGSCPPDWKSSSTLHYCYKVGVALLMCMNMHSLSNQIGTLAHLLFRLAPTTTLQLKSQWSCHIFPYADVWFEQTSAWSLALSFWHVTG